MGALVEGISGHIYEQDPVWLAFVPWQELVRVIAGDWNDLVHA